jgi:hypothetical protein
VSDFLHIFSALKELGQETAVLRIRDLVFDPWIRDGKKSGSGLNIPDHFSESLDRYLLFLGLKISGIRDGNIRIRDSG